MIIIIRIIKVFIYILKFLYQVKFAIIYSRHKNFRSSIIIFTIKLNFKHFNDFRYVFSLIIKVIVQNFHFYYNFRCFNIYYFRFFNIYVFR